jgi:tetratricopeptide (TPR) repeat protein
MLLVCVRKSPLSRIFSVALFVLLGASSLAAEPLPPHGGMPPGPEGRAEVYLAARQFEQALQAYRGLVEKDPESSRAIRGLVRAYEGLGRRAAAETDLKERLKRHPSASAVNYGLGYLYYLEKRDAEAEERFQEAVRQNSANALAWNNWGALKIRTKSYTEAVEMVQRAIALDPHNSMFYSNLYRVYQKLGDSGLFFAKLRKHKAAGDEVRARGYGKALARDIRQQGFRLYAEGKTRAALEKFAQVVEVFKASGDTGGQVAALFGLGLLYEELGDKAKAGEIYREVLVLSPGHMQAREKVEK